MTKGQQIRAMEVVIDDLRASLAGSYEDNAEQRKTIRSLQEEVFALHKGVVAKYEITTITQTGSRDIKTFTEIIDALHWATDKRISGAFNRVTINKVETRRQALYPDGRVI